MEKLYEFSCSWHADGRSERLVCQGRRKFIERFILKAEFASLFGGYILSEGRFGTEYLGVWSRRTCQRFRRILRERGAEFGLSTEPPKLRIKVASRTYDS